MATNPAPGSGSSKRSVVGQGGPRQARAVRTRAAVLDAAAELFADRGFPSVTIQDIAELAGATKGAVYFHFPNKEAMAVELVEAFHHTATRNASAVMDPRLPPLDAVRALVRGTAQRLRDDAAARAAVRLQAEQAVIETELPTPFVDYAAFVTLLLTRAADAGELPPGREPATLARVLVASFFGVQHVSWVLHDRMDVVERVDELLDLLLPT
ncbi:ScbR family autoregulator-binding transcription factor [Kitasatospora sp. NPDC059571]|uniref:ScbR family autoregulator-binding transcription factor n=1 Tax=Kitasatospora sp. NPDC059571 TaxID=3346871 RepID=UPI0036874923